VKFGLLMDIHLCEAMQLEEALIQAGAAAARFWIRPIVDMLNEWNEMR